MTTFALVLAAAAAVSPAAGDASSPSVVERLITEAGVSQRGAGANIRLAPDGDGLPVRAAVQDLRVEVRLAAVSAEPARATAPATVAPAAAVAAAAVAAAVPTTAAAPAAAPAVPVEVVPEAPSKATAGGPLVIEVPPATPASTTPPTVPGTVQPGTVTGTGTGTTPVPTASGPVHPASLHSAPLRVSVVRTVEPDGRVVLTVVGPDGARIGRPTVRNAMDLPVLSSQRDSWGRIVRIVTDGSGAPIEVLLDPMGRFLSARALDGSTASR